MISFIISSIIIFGLGILSEIYIRKKFGIEKREGFIYKGVNELQRWVEGSILVIFLILFWFLIDYVFHLLIFYFVILNLFRALMEWRYEREEKRYLLTLHLIIIYLLILGSLSIFYLNE
ncbi:DUF4181 domain-containing protein [Lysinibacillus telephonicus]|uniref:DUF4181 domain-containing protein n=1 Tax=Lysinibacillus telephonicus TaxID=1714840 RepID=UPI0037CE5A50